MGWNAEAAATLRQVCGLTAPRDLARNLRWWKQGRGRLGDAEIHAVVRGVPLVMRTRWPWMPCELLGKHENADLWGRALSAYHQQQARLPSTLGAVMRRLQKGEP